MQDMEFGRLTVIAFNKTLKSNGMSMWECKCSCGKSKSVRRDVLLNGEVSSCGCLRREVKTKHGKRKTKVYDVWASMIQRCSNPNSSHYHYYGGRGIGVCERWQEFKNFYADMGEPMPGLTIERVNNEKGYSPDNCKWATQMEQNNNSRRCRNYKERCQ